MSNKFISLQDNFLNFQTISSTTKLSIHGLLNNLLLSGSSSSSPIKISVNTISGSNLTIESLNNILNLNSKTLQINPTSISSTAGIDGTLISIKGQTVISNTGSNLVYKLMNIESSYLDIQSGSVSDAYVMYINGNVLGTISNSYALGVYGNTYLNGPLLVSGPTTLTNNLIVNLGMSATSLYISDIGNIQNLIVPGTLSVSNSSILGSTTMIGSLLVTSVGSINATSITVTSLGSIQNLIVPGTLSVSNSSILGSTTMLGPLLVTSVGSINATSITVTSLGRLQNLIIPGTLSVSGSSVLGSTTMIGSLLVTSVGSISATSITVTSLGRLQNLIIPGTLSVSGSSILSATTMIGSLLVTSVGSINATSITVTSLGSIQNLIVPGSVRANGAVYINSGFLSVETSNAGTNCYLACSNDSATANSNAYVELAVVNGLTGVRYNCTDYIFASLINSTGPSFIESQTYTTLPYNIRTINTKGYSNYPSQPTALVNFTTVMNNVSGDGTGVIILYNNATYDNTLSYNTTTGKFTPPILGNYLVNVTGLLSGLSSSHTQMQCYINVGTVTNNSVMIWNLSGAAIRDTSGNTSFCGSALIRATTYQPLSIGFYVLGGAKSVGVYSGSYYNNASFTLMS